MRPHAGGAHFVRLRLLGTVAIQAGESCGPGARMRWGAWGAYVYLPLARCVSGSVSGGQCWGSLMLCANLQPACGLHCP